MDDRLKGGYEIRPAPSSPIFLLELFYYFLTQKINNHGPFCNTWKYKGRHGRRHPAGVAAATEQRRVDQNSSSCRCGCCGEFCRFLCAAALGAANAQKCTRQSLALNMPFPVVVPATTKKRPIMASFVFIPRSKAPPFRIIFLSIADWPVTYTMAATRSPLV